MKPLLLIDEKTLIDTNAQSPSKALKKTQASPLGAVIAMDAQRPLSLDGAI